jgi:hypothetical protein
MRRMTVCAGHLALAHWMMRRLEEISVLGLMTTCANLDLGCLRLHRILLRVQRMAARARDVAGRVCARGPVVCCIGLVTPQAIGVLLGRRCDSF